MRLGIFAKTFARPQVEEVFDAVKEHHFDCVQFNLAYVGLPTLPDEITPSLITRGGGILDYDQYVHLLHAVAFNGPLILHGLSEGQVDAARRFLCVKLHLPLEEQISDRNE